MKNNNGKVTCESCGEKIDEKTKCEGCEFHNAECTGNSDCIECQDCCNEAFRDELTSLPFHEGRE